eukprot:scaffold10109_cov57-Phaeocystis_antarctica.AAC.4
MFSNRQLFNGLIDISRESKRALESYIASAWLRESTATRANKAFINGALGSAAARSKCVAASLSSATERGPASQRPPLRPRSTQARMPLAGPSFGAALATLADSALSPSSFHHSGLATSAHSSRFSRSKALAVATAQCSEPTGSRSLASRNRCAASTSCPEVESITPRLRYAIGSSGRRAMASRQALAALRQSSLEEYRAPSAISSSYASPVCAASRATSSAISRVRCCAHPPSSAAFQSFLSFL